MTDPTIPQPLLRPLICDPAAPGARPLAGGALRFDRVEEILPGRRRTLSLAEAEAAAPAALAALNGPPPVLMGRGFGRPWVMGVLNVTPDSFSDGGRHAAPDAAIAAARAMLAVGAEVIDVGGESTRPGSEPAPTEIELQRVIPVIEGVRAAAPGALISIDTRKAEVARAAFAAGARLFNDVSALTYDPASMATAAELMGRYPDGAVCLMHYQGDPQTMQNDPRYEDVLWEVGDWLRARRDAAVAAGIPAERITLDPGIGFGKTLAHNVALLEGLGALHSLGAPILLGVSRKRFVGALSNETDPAARAPGSIAAGIFGLARGAQILRVHDVPATIQALRVWGGLNESALEERA